MHIYEIKEQKKIMDVKILNLIQEFEKSTETFVDNIHISHTIKINDNKKSTILVNSIVSLNV